MYTISQHLVTGGWAPFCVDSTDDRITDSNRHVELVLRWRQRVVDVQRVRGVDEVRVGSAADDHVSVPVSSFAVLQRVQQRWQVQVPPGVGVVAHQEGRGALTLAGAGSFELLDGATLTLDLGAHTLQVRTVARSRSACVPAVFDALWANTGVVVAACVVALLAALWWHPADVDDIGLEALQANASKHRAVLLAPTTKANAFLQRLDPLGKVTAKQTDLEHTVAAVKHGGAADVVAGNSARTDEAVVAENMRALFGDDAGVRQVLGAGDASALNVALKGVPSTVVAAVHADVRGTGGHGNGDAAGTISVGAIHTRAGKGAERYGDSIGGLGAKLDRDIIAHERPVCVFGVFDPELIRRVVREHVGQVRYCYERALSSTPGLAGRVLLQWTINATGHVIAASVDDGSTLRNSDVEACLLQRVKRWQFLPPKDGGVVVVKYPFIFNRAG
jgi:TonB family protein